MSIFKLKACSSLSFLVTGLILFFGTMMFSYALHAENPWAIAGSVLFGTLIFFLFFCCLGWLAIALLNWKFKKDGNDDTVNPTTIDFLILIPAVCLIVFSSIFALIGIPIFISTQLGVGTAAAAIAGSVFGTTLLIICCIVCIIASCCKTKVSILGGFLNNKHFISRGSSSQPTQNFTSIEPTHIQTTYPVSTTQPSANNHYSSLPYSTPGGANYSQPDRSVESFDQRSFDQRSFDQRSFDYEQQPTRDESGSVILI